MIRDYRPLLEAADELARYQGYLGPEQQKEVGKLEGQFASERRKFVYDLVSQDKSLPELLSIVNSDLMAIEAKGTYYDYSISRVREELKKHITKQKGSSPLIRFATRWGPPTVAALLMGAYFYLKLQAAN